MASSQAQSCLSPGEDRSPALLGTAFTLVALACVAVGLRFYSRWYSGVMFGSDDWLILVPMILSLAYTFSAVAPVRLGFGKHYACASPEATPLFLRLLFAWDFLYTLIITTTKLSILLFYRRIFKVPSFIVPFWCLVGLVTAWGVAIIIVSGFICTPVAAFWDAALQASPTTKCLNLHAFYIGNSVPNIVTDILLLAIPLPFIWRLNTSGGHKLALIAVFGFGGGVVAVSIGRLVALIRTDSSSPDVTWNDLPEALWTIVEENTAIICACLPSLGPLLKAAIDKTPFRLRTLPKPSWAKYSVHTIGGGKQRSGGKLSHHRNEGGASPLKHVPVSNYEVGISSVETERLNLVELENLGRNDVSRGH